MTARLFHPRPRLNAGRVRIGNLLHPAWLLPVVWLLALVAPAAAQDPGADPFVAPFLHAQRLESSRILEGTTAPPGTFPAALQVGVPRPGPPGSSGLRAAVFCGAALIAPRWALTAAHCLVRSDAHGHQIHDGSGARIPEAPQEVAVLGGSLLRSAGRLVRSTQVVVHPDYLRGNDLDDIGLIALSEPMEFPASPLPTAAMMLDVLAPRTNGATVIGWGVTDPDSSHHAPMPSQLMQVTIDVLDQKLCPADLHIPADKRQFCAGVVDRCTPGHPCPDSCQGDSGGPLYVKGPFGQVQAGIVSSGIGCGERNFPGVYTSVGWFEPWIRKYVQDANFVGQSTSGFEANNALVQPYVQPPIPDQPFLAPGVTVSLPLGGRIRLGQEMRLSVMSNVPGRLLLFNEDAEGGGFLIMPNAQSRADPNGPLRELIAVGEAVQLPDPRLDAFSLPAEPPLGRNRIVALVVPAATPGLEAAIVPRLAQSRIPVLRQFLRQVAATLQPGQVAAGVVDYEIVP